MKNILVFFFLVNGILLFAQNKTLDHIDFDNWNNIENQRISTNGLFATYTLKPGKGDSKFVITNLENKIKFEFDRGQDGKIDYNENAIIFKIKPHLDSLNHLKRIKTKKEDLPKDTLCIFYGTGKVKKIPNLKSFDVPRKWGGTLIYQIEPPKKVKKEEKSDEAKTKNTENKSAEKEKVKKKKPKSPSKENGYHLIIHNLSNGKEDTIHFVTAFGLAEDSPMIWAESSGKDSADIQGLHVYDIQMSRAVKIKEGKGHYSQMQFSPSGSSLAFGLDQDTSKIQIRPFSLYLWEKNSGSCKKIGDNKSGFLPKNWLITAHSRYRFSKDGSRLYLGIQAPPVLKDTTLLDSEIVNVEVWHYQDDVLYTQQSVKAEEMKKKNFDVVYHIASSKYVVLSDVEISENRYDRHRQAKYALGLTDEKYFRDVSWDGFPVRKDIYLINQNNGKKDLIGKGIQCNPGLSPEGKFAYWWNFRDTTWQFYDISSNKLSTITDRKLGVFYNELHDAPSLPRSYGAAGFLKDESAFLFYDRYDIWKKDPKSKKSASRITQGRKNKIRYRVIRLDRDELFIGAGEKLLLYVFDEKTKDSGYAWLDLKTGKINAQMLKGKLLNRFPTKAKKGEKYLFSRESFNQFPDLEVTTDLINLDAAYKISMANPQQKNYAWGSIELVKWKDMQGLEREGMLVKPANFDSNTKYPMIVNFYEKSSDGLNRHRRPAAGRSTINYSFFASRGYLIFNPNVHYAIGDPGESAYNAVVSGTKAMIEKGFVDEDKIGLQGHSWGGYQVAHIATKTDMFACIESGAPVVNMTSAYGGIRWQTGLSRMFQYENTQSRLGGTLWSNQSAYLRNSPLFELDKVSTPILIMHNDADGHVPWYQGIEFFVAMRRLGKPAWMLNYNDEPHWPLKYQNKRDFNIRMQQFFDHYLKSEPMPQWMKVGLPAIEKGINQGYNLSP